MQFWIIDGEKTLTPNRCIDSGSVFSDYLEPNLRGNYEESKSMASKARLGRVHHRRCITCWMGSDRANCSDFFGPHQAGRSAVTEYPWETLERLGDEALAKMKQLADALVEEWNEESEEEE